MTETGNCPHCRSPVPDEAPEGLCPRCLLRSGLESVGEQTPATNAAPGTSGALPCFDSYRAVGVLGEGGMGIVYLAEQERPIRRRVALKVLKRNDGQSGFILRFESERQALALMNHPNIARVYDAGATEDGRPYFVMEYVPGLPITDYCDKNMLGVPERLRLFQQVCEAVQHAHQRGIIHRDLKPSNILIALEDGQPMPKIIDFGVAKAVHQHLAERTLFTECGVLIGTPEYMSPEQADRGELDIDTRTDIYSLGVLLYELLVGALPFDPKALRRAGYAEVQRVIRELDPLRPTARLSELGKSGEGLARLRNSDVRSLARTLHGDLEWITMKALEKDRTRRYASASEFAADIARHFRHEPVAAGPPSLTYRLRKFSRRHRGKMAATGAVLAALVTGLVASTALYVRAEHQRAAAEWQQYKAQLAAARSAIDEFRSVEARDLLLQTPKAQRGWEWRYLYWLLDTTVATLYSGEGGQNSRIAFSRDGSRLIVSTGTSVHVWETGSFRRSGDYGPFGPISAITADGSRVACRARGGKGNSIQIVDVVTGRQLAVLDGHRSGVVDASFSADGSRLATLSSDQEIRVWDTASGRMLRAMRGSAGIPARPDGINHEVVALSPDGSRVASSEGRRILVREIATGGTLFSVSEHAGPVQFLSFSSDGKRIISLCESVRIWDSRTGRSLSVWAPSPGGGFLAAAESADAAQVATVTWFTGLQIRDRISGDVLAKLSGVGPAAAAAMAYGSDGKYLVCVDNRGVVRVWYAPTLGGQYLRPARSASGSGMYSAYGMRRGDTDLASIHISGDGTRIAIVTGPDLEILDARIGTRLAGWKHAHAKRIGAVAYNARSGRVASGSDDGTVCVWVPGLPSPPLTLKGHAQPVTALGYSPDGTQLASGSEDGTLAIWDAENGGRRLSRRVDNWITRLVFSPDGRTLAAACTLRSQPGRPGGQMPSAGLVLLDAATGAKRPELQRTLLAGLLTAAFSPDGEWLVSGDTGMEGAALWDARSGRQLRRLAVGGKQGMAGRSFAFSPDGTRVVGAYPDGNMSIWLPETGELILQLFRHGFADLQFSPDGSRLYTNTYDAIRICDTRPSVPAEAEELLRSLGRRFPLYCDLREFLQKDRGIEPGLRQTILKMIEGRSESFAAIAEQVQTVLDSAGSGAAAYRQALHRCRLIAGSFPWDAASLGRLGMAQYRTGSYAPAAATLEGAIALQPYAAVRQVLFLSMAHSRLGRVSKAQENLAAAHALAPNSEGSLRTLFQEAESLIPLRR